MSDGSKPPNNLPAVKQVDQAIEMAIKDVVSPAQLKQVIQRLGPKLEIIAMSSQKYHSGPLPSVETAEGYEKVAPGSGRGCWLPSARYSLHGIRQF